MGTTLSLFRLSMLVVGITSPVLVSFASPSCRAIVLELAVQRRFVCTGKPGYKGTGYKGTGYKGTGYKGTGYKGTGYKGNLFIRVVNREPKFFFLPKLVWL